jgi:hypothetical protein
MVQQHWTDEKADYMSACNCCQQTLVLKRECLVSWPQALQDHNPSAAAAVRPLSWDQHLLASISSARKLAGKRWTALAGAAEAYAAAKLAGGLQKSPPRCSDLVWAGLGMAATMLLLGLLVPAVKTWPVVGPWHQQVSAAAAGRHPVS